ncbi:MAG: hypothetical protein GXZ10_13745 [Gammaproteobacteria bacterium]|nr:hypothetical protein [Gammaproteobacteria bacterium]
MRETYPFSVATQENGIVPLSTAQDRAVSSEKRKIQMFADDLSRVLNGEKSKHRWQFVDKAGQPIAAMDVQASGRRATAAFNQNKRKQRANHVPPLERQKQSQTDKAELVDRLYGGKGSLEKLFWPDA